LDLAIGCRCQAVGNSGLFRWKHVDATPSFLVGDNHQIASATNDVKSGASLSKTPPPASAFSPTWPNLEFRVRLDDDFTGSLDASAEFGK
jgi:hypothetical protein